MRRKVSDPKNSLILRVLAVALVLFNVLMWHFVLSQVTGTAAQASKGVVSVRINSSQPVPVAATPSRIGVPVRINIPNIAVDAAVKKVALTADGSMGVPKYPRDTAWYMLGPRPGEIGSAVIAGHVNWWYGATGAFQNLKKIQPGDVIAVQDGTGAIVTFLVREIRTYNARADATDVFGSTDGKAHLNLITCEGVWDKKAQQYSKRLVVFADKVEE